jgi:hypothetical protein
MDGGRELVIEDYATQHKRSPTYYLQAKCNFLSALPKVTDVASYYQRSETFHQDRQTTGAHCLSFGYPLIAKILF